jgi:hypothetical protein
MPLSKVDKEYGLDLITPVDARPVEIDRVFTNLLPILKHEETPLARGRADLVTIDALAAAATRNDTLHFEGFSDYPNIVARWIESDFLSLVKRGDPDKQKVAAPLPMHLNTYKLRNLQYCRDYGVAMQIFSLLYYGAPDIMRRLRDYLLRGADYESDKYDERTPLDIETLLMMRILDQQGADRPDRRKQISIPVPLCRGQGQLLGDDIDRLLAYEKDVPRLVLIGYIKNIMALHVGIYMLRLFHIVPDIAKNAKRSSVCENCHVGTSKRRLLEECPYAVEIITDMGEDYRTPMAELARQQFETHWEQLNTYIRAHLTLKKLHEFGKTLQDEERLSEDALETLEQVAALRDFEDQSELKNFFRSRIRDLIKTDGEERDERLVMIQRMGLNELEAYIEMLHLLRQRFHEKYYRDLFDSVFLKNRDNGLLRQGIGKTRNKRRYAMGSGLLETLVQIAVIERAPNGTFRTRHIRIDEFIDWLQHRYGIYISRLPEGMTPSIADLEALRQNVIEFKRRLRDIGFYTDLSDAYIAQVIQPRYSLMMRQRV